MQLSRSEQVTLHFYKWEQWGRGYYLFDIPVDIEPPYQKFEHRRSFQSPVIDDGQVPSILSRVKKLISSEKKEEREEQSEVNPTFLKTNEVPDLVGFSLSFSKGQEIQPKLCQEFLGMLSYTSHPISFEVIGTSKEIIIQLVCSIEDEGRVISQLKAYFPTVEGLIIDPGLPFDDIKDIAICDFGMNDEFMRPIEAKESFQIDPLTSIIANLDSLQEDDVVVFQTIFKGVTAPWSRDVIRSVSDGVGGSFFNDSPEMLTCAKEKVSHPLFSVVMRIGAQGKNDGRSQYLVQELSRSISTVSNSQYNKLIPLSNDGYKYDFHWYNLLHRTSNRLGFIINVKELATFVHYPNKTVISSKLKVDVGKTKELPREAVEQQYVIGVNSHNGIENEVTINDEMRLRHTHIIGATGVGKSTLIANMMIEDIEYGNGCALFDPHGDIVEDILARVPEHRKNDVILIDPSDTYFPLGFNLLGASTEAEKIVLSSDLVSAFKRHASAWGDNMTAVLGNVVNTFLESSRTGTLIELKRFLLEESFRNEFLQSVVDPSILYYWEHEYTMVKKGIAPLLTRIDTFLRPKIVRYMLAQTGGIDFKECIEQKKIVLIKLSQGLIGEDNSYLLGSLFLSKFNQVAQGRQLLAKSQRHPYFIYLDEFQNFITPSITSILSGARKYGLGLILAHQELAQIDDVKTLNSVISNPYTRICFRLGDVDAKRLESGFSYFKQEDLQNLSIGQAIIRFGSSSKDCNMQTFPLGEFDKETSKNIRTHIVTQTRELYGKSLNEIKELIDQLLPKRNNKSYSQEEKLREKPLTKQEVTQKKKTPLTLEKLSKPKEKTTSEEAKSYLKNVEKQEEVRKHRAIQNQIKVLAQQYGFNARIEEETKSGGRVDVGLSKDDIRIAVEISVTNTVDYEVENIKKCLESGYDLVYLVSEDKVHRNNIQKKVLKELPKKSVSQILYIEPQEFINHLELIYLQSKPKTENRVNGWKVNINYQHEEISSRYRKFSNKILNALKKKNDT